MGRVIGITTTVPIEVLLAAGCEPVDLNNLFIGSSSPEHLLAIAERDGFPQNCCAWIKGIYGACMSCDINTVLCVTTGDCSNTIMLMEVLKLRGLRVVPFSYPDRPNIYRMRYSLEAMCESLGTTLRAAEKMREELVSIRSLTAELDAITWKEGLVSGWENHLWLVSSSDFNRDREKYEAELGKFINCCHARQAYSQDMLRLAYIGVPAVFPRGLYHYLEDNGARVVFNEIQRQFSMPYQVNSLAEQYCHYTYPYSISGRLDDIMPELHKRHVDGVIHYVQTFCHRGIGEIIMRHNMNLPILTIEGNSDYTLTQHLRTKLEAFLDMLRRNQRPVRTSNRENGLNGAEKTGGSYNY